MKIEDIKNRIYQLGRDIEVAQYNYFFEDDSNEFVAVALSLYQNEDGGFGGDLEPDSMNPNSTPFQTSVALEILTDVGFKANTMDNNTKEIVKYATEYLIESLKNGIWVNTIPSNNDYSSAIWWKYNEEQSRYNPTASILASLLLLLNRKNKYYQRILELTEEIIRIYLNNKLDEKHELICIMRLYNVLDELDLLLDYKDKFYSKLKEEFHEVIDQIDTWDNGYATLPFDFPILENTFELPKELIDANIEHVKKTLKGSHWNITWTWGNDDPAFEMQAIKWQAILAVKNLRMLKRFDLETLEFA